MSNYKKVEHFIIMTKLSTLPIIFSNIKNKRMAAIGMLTLRRSMVRYRQIRRSDQVKLVPATLSNLAKVWVDPTMLRPAGVTGRGLLRWTSNGPFFGKKYYGL